MRYERTHKAAARRKILRSAATQLRRQGIAAVGLRALMADVGLTHGAFYAHFHSRSDLVAQAIGVAMDEAFGLLEKAVREAPSGAELDALVGAYLSPKHRDHPERGCAFASLLPETLREDDEIRSTVQQGVARVEGLIEKLLAPGGEPAARRERAAGIFSSMMGALQISRLFSGEPRSDAALAQGRAAVLALAHQPWDAASRAEPA